MAAPNVKSKTKKEDRDLWATPVEIYNGAIAYFKSKGLNPFRAGQCLSTAEGDILLIIQQVIQGLPKIFEELNS